MSDFSLPFSDVTAARERIRNYIVETPLVESPLINEMTGGRILFKLENLQKGGAFKFRGACNRALQMTPEQKKGGIVAWSSGNHALAVSAVCKMLGMPATCLLSTSYAADEEDSVDLGGRRSV